MVITNIELASRVHTPFSESHALSYNTLYDVKIVELIPQIEEFKNNILFIHADTCTCSF